MSRQNTSSAVMARRVEADDSLDFFPTPPWATRALVEHVIDPLYFDGAVGGYGAHCPTYSRHERRNSVVWEPACGQGHMVRPLREAFYIVHASDVSEYGHGAVADYLTAPIPGGGVDWIITNPPFNRAAEFFAKARREADVGVAFLLRTVFIEGCGRYRDIFRDHPPLLAQFAERVPMARGRVDPNGSTATAYAWFIWSNRTPAGRLTFIPPCRAQLERPGDYDWPGGPERVADVQSALL